MASSLLNSLGITTPVPDPNLYANQKEVTSQTQEVQGKIKDTLGQVNTLVNASKLFGIPDDKLKPILALQAKADSLANSNLSPDQLEKARLELQKELGATDPRSLQIQSILQTLKDVRDEIVARVKEVKADKSLPAELVRKFEAFETKANDTVADYERKAAEPAPAQPSGASGPTIFPAPVPINTVESLRKELASLNTELEKANKKFSFSRLYKVIMFWISISLSIVFVVIHGFFTMNWYRSNFWGLRLYYFIFGGILFPIFQLIFCVKPPYITIYAPWHEPPALDDAQLAAQYSGSKTAARAVSIATTVFSALLVFATFGMDVVYGWLNK